MISIVIPNYNGEQLIRENLPKVIEASKGLEIVVVDDASQDNSISEIKKFKQVKLIRNEINLGFSSAVNKGVRNAKGEIIVLLNTDVYPEKEFLDPLIEHFNDPQVFAVGCLDKSLEKGKIVERGRGIGKWSRGFLVHQRGEVIHNNTLWVSGGSGAFRKSIWEKLGGLNELYNPFYWEDIDLSYRALKSGYKIFFEKKSVVYHNHEKGSINKEYSPFKIRRIAYRNQIIFAWENVTDLFLQFTHFIFLPYHLFRAVFSRDWEFLLAFLDAFVLLPKIIKSSFKAQKLFTRKDSEVMKDF